MNRCRIFFLCFSLCMYAGTGAKGQLLSQLRTAGSRAAAWPLPGDTLKVNDTVAGIYPSPGRVALKSALIPGWGQVVNRDVWKVPIVYAALGGCVYGVTFNNRGYIKYRDAYRAAANKDTAYLRKNGLTRYSEYSLLAYMNDYRRNRDLLIMLTAAAYLGNILDAYVSAHLREFDVTDDLSLMVKPVNFPNIAGVPGWGVSFTLKFR